MTFAVVPAAGLSTRMGRPKLTLPLGDRTVIEHVVTALREGGVDHVLVVVGPQMPELGSLASAVSAEVLVLDQVTADMRETVERGLAWLESRYRPAPDDLWLLAPADCPTLTPAVVRRLLEAKPLIQIAVPVHDGRRGHPTRFAWRHAAGIRALPADWGINGFVRAQRDVIELPVDDPEVLADLDTQGDYERVMHRLRPVV
jgi:molybdenum cofactor cytidylyltransferase